MPSSKIAASVLALSLSIAAGCAGEESPPEREARIDGLKLTEHTAGRVAGTFEREGHRLSFEMRRGADVLEARISDAEGPLLVSVLRDGVEVIEYLGGRARMRGAVGAETPEIEGSTDIFDALNARPAAALVFELKDVLRAADAEQGFIAAEGGRGQMGVRPASWYDGTYQHIPYPESVDFSTWGYQSYTHFELSPEDAYTAASLQALTGWSPPEYTGVIYAGSTYLRRAQYWGYRVRITNINAPFCGSDGCQNTTLLVRKW